MKTLVEKVGTEPLEGVGVLFYPTEMFLVPGTDGEFVEGRDIAREVAATIGKGSVISLPSTRDARGNLLWDFRIECGDPGQVEVRRFDQ